MRSSRALLFSLSALLLALPARGQTIDTAQVRFQQPIDLQYFRAQDKRGLNVFETPKVAGAPYRGFHIDWGAAFTQQFQGLSHSNTADSVFVAAVTPSPGNAGSASISSSSLPRSLTDSSAVTSSLTRRSR